jgi:hypothetical protein
MTRGGMAQLGQQQLSIKSLAAYVKESFSKFLSRPRPPHVKNKIIESKKHLLPKSVPLASTYIICLQGSALYYLLCRLVPTNPPPPPIAIYSRYCMYSYYS